MGGAFHTPLDAPWSGPVSLGSQVRARQGAKCPAPAQEPRLEPQVPGGNEPLGKASQKKGPMQHAVSLLSGSKCAWEPIHKESHALGFLQKTAAAILASILHQGSTQAGRALRMGKKVSDYRKLVISSFICLCTQRLWPLCYAPGIVTNVKNTKESKPTQFLSSWVYSPLGKQFVAQFMQTNVKLRRGQVPEQGEYSSLLPHGGAAGDPGWVVGKGMPTTATVAGSSHRAAAAGGAVGSQSSGSHRPPGGPGEEATPDPTTRDPAIAVWGETLALQMISTCS